MSFIPTPNAVKTDMIFSLAGQEVHVTLWCTRTSPWTLAQRQALNAAISTWWSTGANVAFSSAIALTRIVTVNQDSNNAPSDTLVMAPPVAGGGGATSAANNVAACASLRTDLRGRSFRGRQYWAGIPTGSVTDSVTLLLAFCTSLVTLLTNLKTAIEALGAVWVVVSHYANKLPRASGLATPITAFVIDQKIDSQRRRLAGRGI